MLNYFTNLKIRTKLLLASTVVITLAIIVAVQSIDALKTAQSNFVAVNEDTLAKAVLYTSFENNLNLAIIAAYEYTRNGDPAALQRASTMLQNAKEAKEKFAELTEHAEEEKELADKSDAVLEEVTDEITVLFAIYDEGGSGEALGLQAIKVREAQIWAMFAVHNEIDTFLVGKRERSDAENQRFLTSAINISIALNIFTVLAGIIMALIIAYSISRRIRKLKDAAEEIAQGNIYKIVEGQHTDEIGQLGDSFNKMILRLRISRENLERRVTEKTSELTETLGQLKKEKDRVFHEKEKTDSILYSIGDGVFVIDANYTITLFNRMAADMSGFSIQEAIGKKYSEILRFVYEKGGKVNDAFVREAMATGEITGMKNHTLLVPRVGERISVADSAAPLKDEQGNVIGCVVVFRNITKEREMDRAKSEFVSLASHQLKTPTTGIKWYLDMVLSGDVGKLRPKQEEYFQKIYRGNERLIKLIDAFLNVSRIELGTIAIRPEPLNLKEVANSVLDELKAQRIKKKLSVTKHYDTDLPMINADPQLMRIILENLFSNAVKYTPEHGKIDVKITKQKSEVLITVTDTGYGIPKDQQLKIFSKLFRADNVQDKDTDGTGLGLYIVKSILEKSGGRIWFESEENKGTTFYVAIPLAGMKKKEGTKGLE